MVIQNKWLVDVLENNFFLELALENKILAP